MHSVQGAAHDDDVILSDSAKKETPTTWRNILRVLFMFCFYCIYVCYYIYVCLCVCVCMYVCVWMFLNEMI